MIDSSMFCGYSPIVIGRRQAEISPRMSMCYKIEMEGGEEEEEEKKRAKKTHCFVICAFRVDEEEEMRTPVEPCGCLATSKFVSDITIRAGNAAPSSPSG
ncbi:hypothetical protein EAI_05320 [Harpegnathos saltator]|uniref:Uncharacterized protein n=1 Tax=Harpegnathos saltator TaxID=610380 RepID=E2BL53_HARSA|nr:hypothetical protein EAI_05320 [Harpegnathos saltator]